MSENTNTTSTATANTPIVHTLEDVPLRINTIKIVGNKATRTNWLLSQFQSAQKAKTLGDVHDQLHHNTQRLYSLGVFRSIQTTLDLGPDRMQEQTRTTDVEIEIKEKPRTTFKTELSQELNGGERSASFSGTIRNVFGRAERLEGSISYGDRDSRGFTLSFFKPFIMNSDNTLHAGLFRNNRNYALFSSFRETNRGALIGIQTPDHAHQLNYEFSWRDITPVSRAAEFGPLSLSGTSSVSGSAATRSTEGGDEAALAAAANAAAAQLSPDPSLSIISQAHPSLKSSIHHTYTLDRIQSTRHGGGSRGYLLKLRSEIAGLGGDVQFGKIEADTKIFMPLNSWLTLGLSMKSGFLKPWGMSKDKATHISDRFFLGGPMSLRGFRGNSVGPRDGDDALGGDAYLAFGAELAFRVPHRVADEVNLRGRAYINAGNLVSLTNESAESSWNKYKEGLRTSVGVGLYIPISIGRVELNYSLPLLQQPNDFVQRLQLGLGVDFL